MSIFLHPYDVEVFYFTDKEKYMKHLKETKDIDDEIQEGIDGRALFIQKDNQRAIYIGFFVEDVAILAHECNHAVLFLFQEYGLNPFDSSGEHFCYMHQKLMQDILSIKDN